ncbi:N-acetyltransferase family protein [Streptomyces sp. TR06-5]|uniref:GNAT family N-acetyltransferase n=1 Tax=unclassified Streptomyces TaxID=2593676 RepID=UPI0039A2007A
MTSPPVVPPAVRKQTGHSGPRGSHWRRHLIDLAALFTAVTVTDLAAKAVVGGPHGAGLLASAALVLVVTAGVHGWWSWRRTHASADVAPPVPDPVGEALWRLRATVREEPGALAALCSALADARIDVLAVQVMPLGPESGDGTPFAGGATRASEATVDELLVRAPAVLVEDDLMRMVAGAGAAGVVVVRADVRDLVDGPTRALELAARVAGDPAALSPALQRLLGPCTVRSVPDTTPGGRPREPRSSRDTFEPHRLRLGDPAGGVLVVERPRAPFTPVEYARARALVAHDRRPSRRRWDVTAGDGCALVLRSADTHDLAAVRALHARCSRQSLAARYHGRVADLDTLLGRLLSPRSGRTLVAENASGRVVAVGHLLWDGTETEAALLVEDAWQGRGVGSGLLRQLVALAWEDGCSAVYAVTGVANSAMVAAVRGLGLPVRHRVEDGTVRLSVRLTPLRRDGRGEVGHAPCV